MHCEEIVALIESGLAGARAWVRSDDGTHFEAIVVSPEFEGQRSVRRHQMVYQALGERMGREIHAMSVKVFTPEEWAVVNGAGASPDAGQG